MSGREETRTTQKITVLLKKINRRSPNPRRGERLFAQFKYRLFAQCLYYSNLWVNNNIMRANSRLPLPKMPNIKNSESKSKIIRHNKYRLPSDIPERIIYAIAFYASN
jgi:hypothetical protein